MRGAFLRVIVDRMNDGPSLMVFTDLDGTLIDHETYAWDAARPALRRLRQIGAGVVLASSKTSAEICELRQAMGWDDWPAIVENGAGVLPPHVRQVAGQTRYAALRSALDDAAGALRRHFVGFGDMTTAEVADLTGLSHDAAQLARQREFSEPGLWHGTPEQRTDFVARLASAGVIAQQGGRFLTLSFGGNKVDQMRDLIATYRPDHTIALGDAPNDVRMLEQAQYGIVIANPHGAGIPALNGESDGRIIRSTGIGPVGWNQEVLSLINTLNLPRDQT